MCDIYKEIFVLVSLQPSHSCANIGPDIASGNGPVPSYN